jgi:uncharacterized membrane protein
MPTTAWRFSSTEGADAAVSKLKQLDAQELIDVEDVTVIRWPQYASTPTAQEHVNEEGSKVSSMVRKIRTGHIERTMIEQVKGDLTPGMSAMVLQSSDAAVGAVAKAFEDQPMELIRSDLSVEQQDAIRATFRPPPAPGQGPPPAQG